MGIFVDFSGKIFIMTTSDVKKDSVSHIEEIPVKLFLLIAGFIAAAAGLIGAVASFGPDESCQYVINALAANGKGVAAAGVLGVLGLVFAFIAGRMFGKGEDEFVPPDTCPECRGEVERGTCAECGVTFGPARYSLDSASMIGGILALLLFGGMVGAAMAKSDPQILGLLFISALSVSAASALMGLCSILAERRKIVLAVIGVVISGAVLGTGIFLII